MPAIRASEEVKIVMQLNHVAVFEFDISIQISSCLQFIEILSITSLKLFESSKNLKKSMHIRLNQIFGFCFVSYLHQAFIQFFSSFFVIEHFSLEELSVRLVKTDLRSKVLNNCYLKMIKSIDQYSQIYRNWY